MSSFDTVTSTTEELLLLGINYRTHKSARTVMRNVAVLRSRLSSLCSIMFKHVFESVIFERILILREHKNGTTSSV